MYQISLRCILPLRCGTSTHIMRTGLNVNSRHQMSRRNTVLVAISRSVCVSGESLGCPIQTGNALQDLDDVVRADGLFFLAIGRNRHLDARRQARNGPIRPAALGGALAS